MGTALRDYSSDQINRDNIQGANILGTVVVWPALLIAAAIATCSKRLPEDDHHGALEGSKSPSK